jgi:heme/copper-type cytochrome/quinol oxidase subunit 2
MINKNLSYNPLTTFQMGFQDPASPVAEGISAFHNDLRVLIRFILRFVVFVLHYCLTSFSKDASIDNDIFSRKTVTTKYPITHGTILEVL